jgi:hypothetical protein
MTFLPSGMMPAVFIIIYFEAPGLSGIAENKVWRVTDW